MTKRDAARAGLVLILACSTLMAQKPKQKPDTVKKAVPELSDSSRLKYFMTYKDMPAEKLGKEFRDKNYAQDFVDKVLAFTGADSARADSVQRYYADAVDVSQQGAAADTGKKGKKTVSTKRIPITKEEPEKTNAAPKTRAAVTSTTSVRTEEDTETKSTSIVSCGNTFSCHKVLTTVGTVTLVALLSDWAYRQGWFRGGGGSTNVSTVVTVVHNRLVAGLMYGF